MRYQILPYTRLENGEYSLPDVVLAKVWSQLNEEGRAEVVFYEGGVKSLKDWFEYIKRPSNYFVFVVDSERKRVVFAAWLNKLSGHIAYSHFFGLGPYNPEMGRAVIRYWKSMGLPLLLIGIIPESNDPAIKLAQNLGYKKAGAIPRFCHLVDEGAYAPGVALYFDVLEEQPWEKKAIV